MTVTDERFVEGHGRWSDVVDKMPEVRVVVLARLASLVGNVWYHDWNTLRHPVEHYEENNRISNVFNFLTDHCTPEEVFSFIYTVSRTLGKSFTPFEGIPAFERFREKYADYVRGASLL